MRLRYSLTLALTALATQLPVQGSSLLLTPAQLNSELRDPRLVILYVGPREDYNTGHIAGARFVGMEDVAAPRATTALSLELPDEADLRQRLERLGISDNSKIVVTFGADWVSPSTRIVWTLQTAGLGANTRFLDGGTRAWKRAGLPLTPAEPPAATPGKITVAADRSVVVDYRWVQAQAKAPRVRLIDARSPVFYEGGRGWKVAAARSRLAISRAQRISLSIPSTTTRCNFSRWLSCGRSSRTLVCSRATPWLPIAMSDSRPPS